MKLSKEQKKHMLYEVIFEYKSYVSVAKANGVNPFTFEKCVARAKVHGIENVLREDNNKHYPNDFKLSVVQYIEQGHTFRETFVKFNLAPSIVVRWFRKYSEGGTEMLFLETRGRKSVGRSKKEIPDEKQTELQQLKKRNQELVRKLRYAEMENEFLKKLDALVQERVKRENGK